MQYIHYGCGGQAPEEWNNYDAAWSLKVQNWLILGWIFKWDLRRRGKGNLIFPENVKYGNIIDGLPNVKDNSVKGVYCSHVLEHLSLSDFHSALKNTFKILAPGGRFRLIVPDLEFQVKKYLKQLDAQDSNASHSFMKNAYLGRETSPRGLREKVREKLAFPYHLWMWDEYSMTKALSDVGFKDISRRTFGDTEDEMFKLVEKESRTIGALVIESTK